MKPGSLSASTLACKLAVYDTDQHVSTGFCYLAAMNDIKADLFGREVVPFYLSLVALVLVAILCDALLHLFDIVWVGRYLGIPGTLMILASFGYSLRKRKIIHSGNTVKLLRWHERLAWAGSLLILVHAGIHFNTWLPWLAIGAMMLNVGSGLTGKFLLRRAHKRLEDTRAQLKVEGLTTEQQDDRLHWDSLMVATVKQWRVIHYPITLAFVVLALTHIISILLFWGWN